MSGNERCQVCWGDPDGIQDPNLTKLPRSHSLYTVAVDRLRHRAISRTTRPGAARAAAHAGLIRGRYSWRKAGSGLRLQIGSTDWTAGDAPSGELLYRGSGWSTGPPKYCSNPADTGAATATRLDTAVGFRRARRFQDEER